MNGTKLLHANHVVTVKFALAGVEGQEAFFVAPLGSNQMILGMPWLERVNPDINWKQRTLTYYPPSSLPSLPGTIIEPISVNIPSRDLTVGI